MGFRIGKVADSLRDFWIWEVGRFWFALTHLLSRSHNGTLARRDITHAYVNVFVEFFRAAAYLLGHVVAVLLPLVIIASIWK